MWKAEGGRFFPLPPNACTLCRNFRKLSHVQKVIVMSILSALTTMIPVGLLKQLPILLVVVPMLSAPLCIILRRPRLTWALAMAVTWGALGTSVLVLQQVLISGTISYNVGDWEPPLGIELRIDIFNAFVLVIVTGISAIVLTAAPRSLEVDVPRAP